ncbi:MAG TPA: carboxypeptidase-like regulatory domain-containing protein, partial [Chitinophagaceae bacterium]
MENSRPIQYTVEDIRRYRKGLMSREEMHAFEKASMEDPFLADALEGYMEADMDLADRHLTELSKRVSAAGEADRKGVVVSMPKRSFGIWRVAAMIIVIAGAGLLTYRLFEKSPDQPGNQTAQHNEIKPANTNQSAIRPGTGDTTTQGTMAAGSPFKEGNKSGKTETEQPVARNGKADEVKEVSEQPAQVATLKQNRRTQEETRAVAMAEERQTEKAAAPVSNAKDRDDRSGYANLNSNQFRGQVLTPTNQPLPNANIRIDNSKQAVLTNQEGYFSMNARDTVLIATVTSKGFIDTRVQLRPNTDNTINIGNIVLQPDPSFEQVAVTGLGVSKKKQVADTLSTKPEGGWESFQQYVASQLNIEVDTTGSDQRVTRELVLEFFVNADGTPENFKIINSSNAQLSEQVIAAVRQGPRWTTRMKKTRIL